MKEDNLIDIVWNYKSQKNEKKICYVSLSMEPNIIEEYISYNKIRLGDKQREIIEFLKYNEEVEINDLIKLLKVSKSSITSLQNKNLIIFNIRDYYRSPKEYYDENKKEIDYTKYPEGVEALKPMLDFLPDDAAKEELLAGFVLFLSLM